jgi:alpha-methylacyl-CoA racemase
MRAVLAQKFGQRSRDEWSRIFANSDACVTPVLTLSESLEDPHLRARNVFVDVAGISQPAPAPLLSRTPAPTPSPPRTESLTPTRQPPFR